VNANGGGQTFGWQTAKRPNSQACANLEQIPALHSMAGRLAATILIAAVGLVALHAGRDDTPTALVEVGFLSERESLNNKPSPSPCCCSCPQQYVLCDVTRAGIDCYSMRTV